MSRFFESRYFVHHLLVHCQTSGGIDDDYVGAFHAGVADGLLGDVDGVLVALFGEDGHLYLASEGLQLADGGRAVYVASHEHDRLVLLVLQVVGQFGAKGGLTRALQTGDEDDGRVAFDVDVYGLGTHELGELLMHDFDHQLSGFDALDDVASHNLATLGCGRILLLVMQA